LTASIYTRVKLLSILSGYKYRTGCARARQKRNLTVGDRIGQERYAGMDHVAALLGWPRAPT